MADSQYIQDVTSATFEAQVLNASMQHPVVVDFWAPWCGPCQSLSPILEKLAAEYAGAISVAKINTDDEQALAAQFGIRSLPTVVLVHRGEIADHFMGLQPESAIREMIDRHAGPAPEAAEDEAESDPLASLDPAEAVALLRQRLQADADNQEIKLELACALLRSGETAEAKQLYEAAPTEARDTDAGKRAAALLQFVEAVEDAPTNSALTDRVQADPTDLKARYQLGARSLLAGQHEIALEQLLEIMQRDRTFEGDLGRRSLVAAFDVIDEPALVTRYRQRMTSLLF